MSTVIDPRGMAVERWSALVAAPLQQFGSLPNSATLNDWMAWAQSVRNLPAISALGVPDPRTYTRWQDWAIRLNEALLQL